MNICEYRVKNTFFNKIEVYREERSMNIVEALSFLGLKKTMYYDAKKRKTMSKRIILKIVGYSNCRNLFSMNDFEKIG